MKNRLRLVLLTGILVTFLSRIFIPIPNATLLQGVGLPLSSKNRFLGFAYVVCSMMVYGALYSLLFSKYGEYNFLYGFCYSVIMGLLIVAFSRVSFGSKDSGYFPKTGKYLLQSVCVIVLYDFITGVLIPCSQGVVFSKLLVGQIEWTLSYSLLSCVPVVFSPLIENFIVYGWRKQQVDLVADRS